MVTIDNDYIIDIFILQYRHKKIIPWTTPWLSCTIPASLFINDIFDNVDIPLKWKPNKLIVFFPISPIFPTTSLFLLLLWLTKLGEEIILEIDKGVARYAQYLS